MQEKTSSFLRVIRRLEQYNTNMYINGLPREFEGSYIPVNGKFLWSVPRSTAQFLSHLVATQQPKAIVELGTSGAYSALWMGHAAKAYGGHVYTFEYVHEKVHYASNNIFEAGLQDTITLIEGDISMTLESWDQPIHMLFLDANKKQYLTHLKTLEPYLVDEAIIVADNVSDHEAFTQNYQNYVLTSPRYKTVRIDHDNGLMLSLYQKKPYLL